MSSQAQSNKNAIRHGLLAQSVVMHGESPEAFEEFVHDLTALYDPQDIVERSYVETMAVCRWRQERFWSVEKCTLEKEERLQLEADPTLAEEDGPTRTADAFRKIADTSRTLDVMSRYQVRFDREYDRALNRLIRKREREQEQKTSEISKRTREVDENNRRGTCATDEIQTERLPMKLNGSKMATW